MYITSHKDSLCSALHTFMAIKRTDLRYAPCFAAASSTKAERTLDPMLKAYVLNSAELFEPKSKLSLVVMTLSSMSSERYKNQPLKGKVDF